MTSPDQWGRAFARQARADFDAWNVLQIHLRPSRGTPRPPRSQNLHFLQMAFEKLARAHLLKAGSRITDVEQSHAYIAKHIPIIVRQQMIRNGASRRVANSVRDQCKHIAREVELLAPAVTDAGRRPDNCEYPWETGGKLYVPAEWSFPNLSLLSEPKAVNILNRVREAIERLAT